MTRYIAIDPGSNYGIVAVEDSLAIPGRRADWPHDFALVAVTHIPRAARRHVEEPPESDYRNMKKLADSFPVATGGAVVIIEETDVTMAGAGARRQGGRVRSADTLFRMGVTYATVTAALALRATRQDDDEPLAMYAVGATEWMRNGRGRIPKREETLRFYEAFGRMNFRGDRAGWKWTEDEIMALGMLDYFMRRRALTTAEHTVEALDR